MSDGAFVGGARSKRTAARGIRVAPDDAGAADNGDKRASFWTRVCRGEAGLLWNCFCCPLVIFYQGVSLYVFACVSVLLRRFAIAACGCCFGGVYIDESFEGQAAIGAPKDGDAYGHAIDNATQVDWVRIAQLQPPALQTTDGEADSRKKRKKETRWHLFDGKIEPADLCQGAVGDCWLVAAFASVAEYPDAIRNAFITREFNQSGKYRVRLYDAQAGKWEVVTVDDRIPCAKGSFSPHFMQLHGREAWAVLLEKAFAKFCGSYADLSGGRPVWAWRALTGDRVFNLLKEGEQWTRHNFISTPSADNRRASAWHPTGEKFSNDETWVLVQRYLKRKSLVAAAGGGDMGGGGGGGGGGNGQGLNGENQAENGLVGTHAYSVLDARELGFIPGISVSGVLGKTKLIQLRNPWGKFEWKGAWSDGSKEWKDNPLIKMVLRPKTEDDGTFWMPWEDFSQLFTKLDVCDRTTSRDLRLDVHEDKGSCGVAWGCLTGCCAYTLCCKGMRVLYGGHRSSDETISAKRGCCGLV